MKQRGFTIVELIIVITVMAILLTVGVVNVRSTQTQGRDNDRHTDAENIATVLESFHSSAHGDRQGTYPGTADLSNEQVRTFITNRIGTGALHAPNQDQGGAWSLKAATSPSAPTSTTLSVSEYIYQPLTPNGTLCANYATNYCSKFNLYYRLERPSDECPAPNNICTIRSLNS